MWILFTKAPPVDAADWPGRRWLAILDALGWPAAVAALLTFVPHPGLLAHAGASLALLCALHRLRIALWRTHRYQFATWKLGRPLVWLILLAIALKITAYG